MNNYIKKCLTIYITLALILIGMASISYAITATDADKYLTRSEYAVDIAHLQSMLEAQEAGLMEDINRYRKTDIKFVTYDTPDYQQISGGNAYEKGYYNGGNFFPRPRTSAATGSHRWYWGRMDAWDNQPHAAHKNLSIFRLWNGNYLLTTPMFYRTSTSTSTSAIEFYSGVNFAVPIENFPGFYVVFYLERTTNSYACYRIAFTRLDWSVPYSKAPVIGDTMKFRFKKDKFVYVSDTVTKLTTTEQKNTNIATNVFQNNAFNTAFTRTSRSDQSTVGISMTCTGQVDPKTGDYLFTISGNHRPDTETSCFRTHELTSANFFFTRFIPSDNVEYVCAGNNYNESNANSGSAYVVPSPIPVHNMLRDYGYEFVDCENGIRYWHCWQKSKAEGSGLNRPLRWHYSLPIVY